MRKPVIAALIAGTVGFGGLVVSAGVAEAATLATVHHPAPGGTKPHKVTRPVKGAQVGKAVPGVRGQNGSKLGKSTKVGAATGNSVKTTKVVAKPKPKGKGGKGMKKG